MGKKGHTLALLNHQHGRRKEESPRQFQQGKKKREKITIVKRGLGFSVVLNKVVEEGEKKRPSLEKEGLETKKPQSSEKKDRSYPSLGRGGQSKGKQPIVEYFPSRVKEKGGEDVILLVIKEKKNIEREREPGASPG